MRPIFLAVLITGLLAAGCGDTPPERSAVIPAVDSLVQQEMVAGLVPGVVVLVGQGDAVLHKRAYGFAGLYNVELEKVAHPDTMTTDHLFDLASLTKVCATTFGIMMLVDEGKLNLDDPVSSWLPEFSSREKRKITIRHLLSHSSGLRQWYPLYYEASGKRERYKVIAGMSLKWPVGESRHYSDLGFMLLGEIIERVSGQPLDRFLDEQLFQPLNLQHTTFNPLEKNFLNIVATSHGNPFEKQMVYDDDFGYTVHINPESWDGWREYTLKGEVNDGNAWYAGGGVAGHAGLFSTAADLQKLVSLLLNRGEYGGKQLISGAVIDTFLTRDRHGNALGWAMDPGFISAEGAPEGTFGHTGFTGTSITVVPQHGLSIIILTNRQHAGRQENGYYYDLDPLRQGVLDAVMEGEFLNSKF